jgi:ribonuclease I
MRDEEDRLVSKSFDDQFFKYVRAYIRVNCTQRIVKEVDVSKRKVRSITFKQ